jgi:hypothetical protein
MRMKSKWLMLSTVALALAAFSVSSIWYFHYGPRVLKESFEEGFGEWVPGADVPPDPSGPEHAAAWNITRSTEVSKTGQYSLKLFIDGRQDDGTIWVARRVRFAGGRVVRIRVSFQLYCESESFNTIAAVCAYIGLREPLREGDFTVLGPANTVKGWGTYSHEAELSTGFTGEAWVAVGISVRWETFMTYYIDDVEILLE